MKLEIDDKLFDKEELENTPKRHKKFLKEWEEDSGFNFTTFKNKGYDELIILKNIEFSSMCSHHLLPFKGFAHIGYIPTNKICGISKLARVLDRFAHKPQLQERIGEEIVNFLVKELKPKGVMVVLEAAHDCMRIRGCKKQNSVMVTSAVRGVFRTKQSARDEFLSLIGDRKEVH